MIAYHMILYDMEMDDGDGDSDGADNNDVSGGRPVLVEIDAVLISVGPVNEMDMVRS